MVGKGNVGVTGNTAVLASIRKHAAALSKAVDRYQEQLKTFRRQFPNRLAYPPEIEYATLFKIQPDDPFWSEGLFTNHNEPWAIDPTTQFGMRQLSYLERSQEELRRIGWEIRREMRWIISTRSRISLLFQSVLQPSLPTPLDIQPLLSHPILSQLEPQARLIAVTNLLHTKLIQLLHHVRKSTDKFQLVFRNTAPQAGDHSLLQEWEDLGMLVSGLGEQGMSMIPGCFSLVERLWPVEGGDEVENLVELVVIEEGEEGEDEEEEIVNQTVLSATDRAVALALDKVSLYEDMDDDMY